MYQECEIIMQARAGDRAAMESVFFAQQPLICMLARRLCWNGMQTDELIQAGNVGLLRALQHFEPERRVKLATYAVPWILGEMRSALRQADRIAVSLDEARGEEQSTLMESIVGENGPDLLKIDLHLSIQSLLQEEQMLICLRYFRDKTQRETAMLLHKSQAQISRMESQVLEKLRNMLSR